MVQTTVLKVIRLPENRGLGNALREALKHCENNLVARMDSDDVAYPYRFQTQLEEMARHPETDVVGGNITEFVGTTENITGVRTVEIGDEAIKRDMKKRCAMNHVSVMYKKDSVMRVGGYIDWYYNEDYYLWVRMMEAGCHFANVPYPLVNVRTGSEMFARRGGYEYYKSEKRLQQYMRKHRIISLPRYLYNVAVRFGGELAVPGFLRGFLYKFLRSKPSVAEHPSLFEIENYPPFSVATSVYGKDDPAWLDMALDSVIVSQTVKPAEVVLVVDGPISNEIEAVIEKYQKICTGTITA